MAWGHFLVGSWPDVTATPTGTVIVRVETNAAGTGTVICEEDGAELWRRTVATGLRPKFTRIASDPVTGEVRAVVSVAIAGNLDRAVVVSEAAETDLSINLFGLNPVAMEYDGGDFVVYLCTSKFLYTRYPLAGAPASMANPFTTTGTVLGIRDVVSGTLSWDADEANPGEYAFITIGTTAFYHYRTRGSITVGQQKGPPETPEGIIASPDGTSVSTVMNFRAFMPTFATASAGIFNGKTVIVARCATVNGNQNVALFAGPPWPDLVTVTTGGGASLAQLAGVYKHPVIDKATGRMTEPWYRTLRALFTQAVAPIDLSSTRVVGMLDAENGGTGTTDGLNFIIDQIGAITDLTGDVTASGPGVAAATIPPETVTYAKMQHVSAASRLLGRGSAAGAGDVEELTLGSNLAFAGTVLNATAGSELTLLTADPGAPSDDTWWLKRSASSPYDIVLSVRISGATTDIPIAVVP